MFLGACELLMRDVLMRDVGVTQVAVAEATMVSGVATQMRPSCQVSKSSRSKCA